VTHSHSNEGIVSLGSFGRATTCTCIKRHSPTPLRYVWHHILPQVCGGKTEASNLVSLCDTAHYAIHALLYAHRLYGPTLPPAFRKANRRHRKIAAAGYAAAVAAGTVDLIPIESALT
jgi:hypothetical protein